MVDIITRSHFAARERQKRRILNCYQQIKVSGDPIKKSEPKIKNSFSERKTRDELEKANRDINDILNLFKPNRLKKINKPLEKVQFEYEPGVLICSEPIDKKITKAIDNGTLSDTSFLYYLEIRDGMKKVFNKFKKGDLSNKVFTNAVKKSNQFLSLIEVEIETKMKN